MVNTIFKNQKLLFGIAIVASLVYFMAMTYMGITKFYSVLQGGENYNDFPTAGISPIRFITNTSYLIALAVYVIWLFQKKQVGSTFLDICKYSIPFLALALIAYPLSNDIYMYLHYGVMSLNKINPYLNRPDSFVSSISPFIHWLQTSTYGPVSMFFFSVSALFVPISPLIGVYFFKLICLCVHILNSYLIWRLLKNSDRRSLISMAYLLNPMLLNEQIVNAHLDVLLANTLIVFIGCLYSGRYVWGILAIWVGLLVKTLPIIWLPLVFAFLFKQRRWKDLAAGFLLSALIITLVTYTCLPTVTAWRSLLNPGVALATARSFHHLISLCLNFFPNMTPETSQSILSLVTRFSYCIWIIYYLWRLLKSYFSKKYSEIDLVSDMGWITLSLFLFATPWLMPWYPSILLPITALSVNAPYFVLTSLTFALFPGIILGGGGGQSPVSILTVGITMIPPTALLILKRKVVRIIGLTQPS
jgi:alpha-1,6-mannosyltransferase